MAKKKDTPQKPQAGYVIGVDMAKEGHDIIKLKTGGGKGKKETKIIDAGDKKKGDK